MHAFMDFFFLLTNNIDTMSEPNNINNNYVRRYNNVYQLNFDNPLIQMLINLQAQYKYSRFPSNGYLLYSPQ